MAAPAAAAPGAAAAAAAAASPPDADRDVDEVELDDSHAEDGELPADVPPQPTQVDFRALGKVRLPESFENKDDGVGIVEFAPAVKKAKSLLCVSNALRLVFVMDGASLLRAHTSALLRCLMQSAQKDEVRASPRTPSAAPMRARAHTHTRARTSRTLRG
jgi:hypothetical protein